MATTVGADQSSVTFTDPWSSAAYPAPSGSGSGTRRSGPGCGSTSSWWRSEHTNPPQSQPAPPAVQSWHRKRSAGSREVQRWSHDSFWYLVSERQSAVDVQAVVTLQLEQGVAQKFLCGTTRRTRSTQSSGRKRVRDVGSMLIAHDESVEEAEETWILTGKSFDFRWELTIPASSLSRRFYNAGLIKNSKHMKLDRFSSYVTI